MALWVLQGKAEIDGTAREPGYTFERPDDWKVPPMNTVRDPADATKFIDVPIAVKSEKTAEQIVGDRAELRHEGAEVHALPADHPGADAEAREMLPVLPEDPEPQDGAPLALPPGGFKGAPVEPQPMLPPEALPPVNPPAAPVVESAPAPQDAPKDPPKPAEPAPPG